MRDNYYQPRGNTRNSKDLDNQNFYLLAKTEVVFQVANESREKRQEEAKVDVGSINVDTNISFRPQRGKQDAKGGSADKPKVNFDQIERDLKDIYKLTVGEEVEDKTDPEEETKKLASKVGGKYVVQSYFKTFHDGRLEAVPKRLFIPNLLIKNENISEDDFINM